jgi:tetratricopeptide (TPR) repeat protein
VQRQAAERRADQARREAEQRQMVESDLDKAAGLRQQAHWGKARSVLGQARQALGESRPDDLRQWMDVAEAELALVHRLDAIRQRRATMLVQGKFDDHTAARDYAAAFREAGLGELGEDEASVAARVRASGVSGPLVAALEDWAFVAGPTSGAWLLGVARRADPYPWRDHFRDPAVWRDRQALRALAHEALRDGGAAIDQLSPQVLAALGVLLGEGAEAVPLWRAAQRRYPNDFCLHIDLGIALHDAKQFEETVGYYRAAVALRPDAAVAHYNLAAALSEKKDLDGPSPRTAGPSPSTPNSYRPTPTSAPPCTSRGIRRGPSPSTTRPSPSTPRTPSPTAGWDRRCWREGSTPRRGRRYGAAWNSSPSATRCGNQPPSNWSSASACSA